jgi:hypothetical protein
VTRLVDGRLAIYTDGTVQGVVVGNWIVGLDVLSSGVVPEPPWLLRVLPTSGWGLLFAAGTVLELSTVLTLVSRAVRLVVVPSLVVFHLVVARLMGINFYENVVLLGVLFTPVWFHAVASAVAPRWPRLSRE